MRNELAAKRESNFVKDMYGSLIGRKIINLRPLTEDECEDMMWSPGYGDIPIVMIFDDGQAAIVSRDQEGNGPGWLIMATAEEVK
jgi:hypothetical protein